MYQPLSAEKAQRILTTWGTHPRYGRLIANAVSGWQKHNIAPAPEIWGVRNVQPPDLPHELWAPSGRFGDEKCACLVSAALFDRGPVGYGIVADVMKLYDLTSGEVWGLVEGFDRSPRGIGKPGYEIGQAIAEILFAPSDEEV